MWKIELTGIYNIINHLIFDTKEEAEVQRQLILPYIGKDIPTVTLTDKYCTIDVAAVNIVSVRCYDMDDWAQMAVDHDAKYKAELVKAKNKEKDNG